ncbi:hypothetical protein ACFZAR_40780, partial [Streptomyces sp. NPDC008222]
MSITMPSGLEWVAKLAGGDWPEADEDRLWDLQQAHLDYAKTVREVAAGLGPVIEDVKSGVSGSTSEQFEQYLRQVQSNLGQVADSAEQVADMCDKTALQVQYAKIMILMMLAWMAAEIAFLAWWCPEGVAAIVAAGRAAVMMIVRRLLAVVAVNVAAAGVMDAVAQLIQFGEGRRHSWDWQNTEMALGAGAISGAITGVLFEVGGVIAPNFLGSLLGKMTVGGVGGGLSMEATDAAFGMDGDPGLGFLAGALGGAIGHIPALRGGKGGDGGEVGRVPDMSRAPDLEEVPLLPGESALDGKTGGLGDGPVKGGDSSGYTRVSTEGKEFQSPTAGGRRHSDVSWEGEGLEGAPPAYSSRPGSSTRSAPDQLGESKDGRGPGYLTSEGGSEYGQGEGSGHSDAWWGSSGSEGATPEGPGLPDFLTRRNPGPFGLSEGGRGRGYPTAEGGSGYGQGESGFGGWRDVPAAVEPGGPISGVQAPPAVGPRFGYGGSEGDEVSPQGDGVSVLGSDEGHGNVALVSPLGSEFGDDSGFARPGGLTERQPFGEGRLAGDPSQERSPAFGSGVTDPTGTASEGIHEDVLSGDGPVWRESPESTVVEEASSSVAEPHSAEVVEGGGSSGVTRPGEVQTGVSAAEHAASDDGALRSLPGRTAEVEEAPSVAEPVNEGAVQQLPQEDRSVQAWLDQVVDDPGSGVGVSLLGQTRGVGEQGLPPGSGGQTGSHQPLAGRAAQPIPSDIRTAGAAPRSSAVGRISAEAEARVAGGVQETGGGAVGGRARPVVRNGAGLESSGPVPSASPSGAVRVGRESGGLSETGPAPGRPAVEGGVPAVRPSDAVRGVSGPEPGTGDFSGGLRPQSSPPAGGGGPAVSGVVRQPVGAVGGPRRTGETAPAPAAGHGGPSDGGRTPQDGAVRAGHGGAPTDRADGPFMPETVRETAARPDMVTGRDRDGNDIVLRLPEGSKKLFDASGELRHVVLPDGVSFERGFDGLWGPPRRGSGEVISRKTDSETVLTLHGGGRVVLGKENERITDTAADKVLMYRQTKDGDGAWLRQPRIFLPHEEGGWVERSGLDTATYEGFLASANKAHEAARQLFDIGARSAHGVPEHERLDRVGEERLKELYW